jgi:CubicO group peptidase (beta-lactamase class C family)
MVIGKNRHQIGARGGGHLSIAPHAMSVITPPVALSPSKLEAILEVFESNFRRYGEIGASISIWWQGNELLCHASGWCEKEQLRQWTERTLIPVYSATKVPSAATLLLALANHGLNENTPLREVWKNFPVAEANFSHLLSHQCGLAILDQDADVHDHDAVVAAIENQIPTWQLGNGHAYHPRSFGALTDEPVRRLTGQTLGQYWREKIAAPLDLEFWIGLPDSEHHRVARLYPGKAGHAEISDPFYQQLNSPDSPTRRAFTSPRGLHSIQEMNSPKAWTAGFPALGGIGTATSLAKFYQAVLGHIESPLTRSIRRALMTPLTSGNDRVLLRPTAFSCGAQLDPLDADGKKIRQIFGPSPHAFGHPGAGGSHAFADPDSGISFAYVMNQMSLGVMPGPKCMALVEALFSDDG